MTGAVRALTMLVLALLLVGAADARSWAWLGVRIRDLSEQEMDDLATRHGIAEGFGVVIVEVMEDTPAARAGMRTGDIVVAFEGRPVTETRLLQRLIAHAPVDRDVRLTVLRAGGRRALPVRLVGMPRPVAGERIAGEYGFLLREGDVSAERPGSSSPVVGAVVRGGPAARAGLEVGDVLLQVNERSVLTRDAAREALSELALDQPLRLTVRRGDAHVGLTLAAPDGRAKP
ncbi:MAG TPA: PDZ domain-containing protein [Methylomirabilota bacterium]|nr:PDZ domain-containing protein [Methylomirabilota bacterium]